MRQESEILETTKIRAARWERTVKGRLHNTWRVPIGQKGGNGMLATREVSTASKSRGGGNALVRRVVVTTFAVIPLVPLQMHSPGGICVW